MKRDGHIHTPFCPHGSKDSLNRYIEAAIEQGFQEITFTEHAPLPEGFVDAAPTKDSAMKLSDMEKYVNAVQQIQQEYKQDLTIRLGLEVDYIEGFEKETTNFLNEYGSYLDDSILSVHFLKQNQTWYCLDYSPDVFAEMMTAFGSVSAIYQSYFAAVHQSILANLGAYKPKRIGHITLVHKFQKKFPCPQDFSAEIDAILQKVKLLHYELDYNGAGVMKPLCGETYPPAQIAAKAKEMGIPLIYGSDAHAAKGIGQGLEQIQA
ncbi:histidinol-phosphatase HisJ [Bacillus sp. REN10]|uniref:histidinol-phosphatase HisJ n=1 Tax=Bacillus sp. REN10 TaxID=2782541 RepID=UPI00193AE6D8|nr:histidinol-phosphatase HisJ [Bacillus sp. REN10]